SHCDSSLAKSLNRGIPARALFDIFEAQIDLIKWCIEL
ncbi:MAG: hypothetical protein ACI8XX_002276, partial [Polaribacter sp.]